MADLIVIGYADEETAGKAAEEVQHLARDLVIQSEAMAVIVRDKEGKFHVTPRITPSPEGPHGRCSGGRSSVCRSSFRSSG